MVEFHGWATIRETYLPEDFYEEKINEIINSLKNTISRFSLGNGLKET